MLFVETSATRFHNIKNAATLLILAQLFSYIWRPLNYDNLTKHKQEPGGNVHRCNVLDLKTYDLIDVFAESRPQLVT